MQDKDILEIYKEAVKAGYRAAIALFVFFFCILMIVSGLFGYYIYKTYIPGYTTSTITQTQDGTNNYQELTNETDPNS